MQQRFIAPCVTGIRRRRRAATQPDGDTRRTFNMNDWKNIRAWSREEMMKRVARFKQLKGSDGGLPDSKLPECRRKLYAVIGLQPPLSESAAVRSPVGARDLCLPAR